TPIIWLLIIMLIVGVTFGFLVIRKKKKLIYDCVEIVDLGRGKTGFNFIKAGWFGKKKYLRKLYDTGEEQLETEDGEVILNFSTEDFQEVNGKRGVVVYRDPINQNMLAPISNSEIKNKELLAAIAPAE